MPAATGRLLERPSTDAGCLAKAAAKIGPALDRLETKKVCLVEGAVRQRTNDAAAYAANVDATVGHAAGKCDSAKTKLVATYVATLANCYAKAAAGTGNIDGTCVTKASVRFTSGIVKAEGGPMLEHGPSDALTNAVETFVQSEACALDPEPRCAAPTPTATPTRPGHTPTPTLTATPICNNGSTSRASPAMRRRRRQVGAHAARILRARTAIARARPRWCFPPTPMPPKTVLDAGWTGLVHRIAAREPRRRHGPARLRGDEHPCGDVHAHWARWRIP